MKEIRLLEKKILFDKSPIILSYKPDKDWQKYFMPMGGEWYEENGYLHCPCSYWTFYYRAIIRT